MATCPDVDDAAVLFCSFWHSLMNMRTTLNGVHRLAVAMEIIIAGSPIEGISSSVGRCLEAAFTMPSDSMATAQVIALAAYHYFEV